MAVLQKDLLQRPINRVRQALAEEAAGNQREWVEKVKSIAC